MISINTNTASSLAAYNLGSTNVNLQKSLQRLSSGSRINNSVDDAGGLAVSMKLSSAIRRTEATQANVNNALSLLQTQDGVLKSVDKVLNRMSELATFAADVTKNDSDISLYNTEYSALKSQLQNMFSEKFNGVSLFSAASETGANLSVVTSNEGNQEVQITQSALTENPFMDMMINGFKKFEVAGRTFLAKADAINNAEFTSAVGSVGLTVYDSQTGEEYVMNTNGAVNSTGSSSSPTSPSANASGIWVEQHSVNVRINQTDGTNVYSGSFSVDYSNNTANTSTHTLAAIAFPNLLGDGSNESSVEQLTLNFDSSTDNINLSILAIQAAATMRANNGSQQSRLTFAADMLSINKVNLESANGRIADVDIACESANLARLNILQQAGTAMLAQANMATQSVLRLLS
jgi:flagellin